VDRFEDFLSGFSILSSATVGTIERIDRFPPPCTIDVAQKQRIAVMQQLAGRLVRRLNQTGRVYEPPVGFNTVATALISWLNANPSHVEQAEVWLGHPESPVQGPHSDRSRAVEDLHLRSPIESALGMPVPKIGMTGRVNLDRPNIGRRFLDRIRSQSR